MMVRMIRNKLFARGVRSGIRTLSLSLLVLRVIADNIDTLTSPHHFTLRAYRLY